MVHPGRNSDKWRKYGRQYEAPASTQVFDAQDILTEQKLFRGRGFVPNAYCTVLTVKGYEFSKLPHTNCRCMERTVRWGICRNTAMKDGSISNYASSVIAANYTSYLKPNTRRYVTIRAASISCQVRKLSPAVEVDLKTVWLSTALPIVTGKYTHWGTRNQITVSLAAIFDKNYKYDVV